MEASASIPSYFSTPSEETVIGLEEFALLSLRTLTDAK
jgi:hypothetical protein